MLKFRYASNLGSFAAALLTVSTLGLAGWLATMHDLQFDWTYAQRASLTEPSRALLENLPGRVVVRVYASPNHRSRRSASLLLERYRRFKSDFEVEYIDPGDVPAELRALQVHNDGDILIDYDERTVIVAKHSESAFSNALERLTRTNERWLAFVSEHGERDFLGNANHDLGTFGKYLSERGVHPRSLRLAQLQSVPSNTALVVISQPQVALLEGEVERLLDYIRNGGNLLWLADPGDSAHLDWLADALGVSPVPGMVVDPSAPLMGIDQPTIIVVGDYGEHEVIQGFNLVTVFPETAALDVSASSMWQTTVLARSGENAWADSDVSSGTASFDLHDDQPGPVTVALALERDNPSPERGTQQRVIVVGDGDFLSNAYIGNGGNLQLGAALVNWLAEDDSLLEIPLTPAPDRSLTLTRVDAIVIGAGSLFVLPGLLLFASVFVWWHRRRRSRVS